MNSLKKIIGIGISLVFLIYFPIQSLIILGYSWFTIKKLRELVDSEQVLNFIYFKPEESKIDEFCQEKFKYWQNLKIIII